MAKKSTELDPRIKTALLSLNPTAKEPTWHRAPTHLGLLRGVDAELAVWTPWKDAACIWQVAMHIAFWENSVANHLTRHGGSFAYSFVPRWAAPPKPLTDAHWKGDIQLAKDVHQRLVDIVAAYDPAALDRSPMSNMNRTAIEFMHGIAEHNLYHGAAIKLIRSAYESRA